VQANETEGRRNCEDERCRGLRKSRLLAAANRASGLEADHLRSEEAPEIIPEIRAAYPYGCEGPLKEGGAKERDIGLFRRKVDHADGLTAVNSQQHIPPAAHFPKVLERVSLAQPVDRA
jgi:hypothetical protein